MEIRLDADELAEARAAIAPLAARLQLEARNAEWEALRYHATHEARARLELDDVSGVPFVAGVPGVEELHQHRARVRARSGGGLAAVTPPADGYEAYNQARLGLGAPWFRCASRIAERPFAVSAACRQPADLAALAEHPRGRRDGAPPLHGHRGDLAARARAWRGLRRAGLRARAAARGHLAGERQGAPLRSRRALRRPRRAPRHARDPRHRGALRHRARLPRSLPERGHQAHPLRVGHGQPRAPRGGRRRVVGRDAPRTPRKPS